MPSPAPERVPLAFIGGTGPEGRGLALRFALLGYPILIGSRSAERAEQAAAELRQSGTDLDITGEANVDAATRADIVVLTVPYAGITDTLPPLAGATRSKVVVSAIAPVEFQAGRPVALRVEAGSAAEEVQQLLPAARVVSAFQPTDAHQLQDVA